MTFLTSPAKNIYNSISELEGLLHNAAISKSRPKVNVFQNEKWTELKIAVPGIDKEKIAINITDNVLRMESICDDKNEINKEEKFLIKEFDYKNFSLEYKLTEKVKLDKIDANYNNGILELKLPYKTEKELHKTMKISLK